MGFVLHYRVGDGVRSSTTEENHRKKRTKKKKKILSVFRYGCQSTNSLSSIRSVYSLPLVYPFRYCDTILFRHPLLLRKLSKKGQTCLFIQSTNTHTHVPIYTIIFLLLIYRGAYHVVLFWYFPRSRACEQLQTRDRNRRCPNRNR